MDNWINFNSSPREEAINAQLAPGDGIARHVNVYDGIQSKRITQQMTLIEMSILGFVAQDAGGKMHACSWRNAAAWSKRRKG